MDTKIRIVALDNHNCEIGSWVFSGPREKAIAKAWAEMLRFGVYPSVVQAFPQEDYSVTN